eukprot:6610139-Prymnesium_polylepis.1
MDAGGGHVRRERDVRQSPEREGRCGCTFNGARSAAQGPGACAHGTWSSPSCRSPRNSVAVKAHVGAGLTRSLTP